MTLLSDQAEDIRALMGSADPAAVWAVGGPEGIQAQSAGAEAAGDTLFDVGGLAAVLALWPAIGALVEEGALRLHTPLAVYGVTGGAGGTGTAGTAGPPSACGAAAVVEGPGITAALASGGDGVGVPGTTTAHHLLTRADGTAALTRLAEHLSGSSLADLAATRVWRPLGMTRTSYADGTLHAPLADLVRFLCHLLAPADTGGITRAWTAESLRIRTGELTPPRGLLWHPTPQGAWSHHAPAPAGPALWISPRHHRWALLLPTTPDPRLRTAFRDRAFPATGLR
ncbi:hypothetical protein [Streptomyces sp. NPDC088762]|uniref:hypothetical protein n=1 Tax=Streptomyces sp. NPDC088762 TaxID=3365891 RepID=UPI00381B8F3A